MTKPSEPDTETVTVTVETPEEEETPTVVDTSDTVVVVSPPAEAAPVSDPIMDRLMTTDQRLNDIMDVLASQGEAIAALAGNQASTTEVVADVQEAQLEAELAEADTEDEIVPDTRHVWFRPIGSFFGRGE